ncbi:EAL domain-containing protein [Arthrobacter sp. SO3]|uniref:EAL domain-containing protein n=1 Tax=Arthrobacter sp. SO3 TaxID=1897057 RepID=UPI001CFF786F|nr:EAL domain-containing protein [Arthrobacter sp. SO3]
MSIRSRIHAVLHERKMLTAFQPICELSSGGVVGAQALTRFLGDTDEEPADWFAGAGDERLGSDLEFAALESAIAAAMFLPAHMYVGLKLSPATCLDPLLPGFLEDADLAPGRMVLELTEAMTREEPATLAAALAPLRRNGVRLAIDHAGSYFNSVRHIRQLRPDFIKLNLAAGIETDPIRSSLGDAMVGFARHIGALVTAQGIETPAELAAVTGLGVKAGQGYLLGAPTTHPEDWNGWAPATQETRSLTSPDGTLRS